MIKCIIFDLDDTLCDYQEGKQRAIEAISKKMITYGIDINYFWQKYTETEPELFTAFLQRKISKEAYRYRRYHDLLEPELGEKADKLSKEFNDIYMNIANRKLQLFDDVIPCLKALNKKGLLLAILTNGPTDGQSEKYASLGLKQYISHFFVGEAMGAVKPSKEAFTLVLYKLLLAPDEVIMVGDSYQADYLGAINAGIRAVLLDRNYAFSDKKECVIHDLSELVPLLGHVY